jgi:hypothetical protein
MFVRWKTRPRAGFDGPLLSAVLVRSERINGKPRQKIVACLASIRETIIDNPYRRYYFWRKVDKRLESLGLEKAEHERIVAALASRVPRPTEAELRQEDRERAESNAECHRRTRAALDRHYASRSAPK